MVRHHWTLIPEEINAFISTIKSLMIQPHSDFERYLIDDSLTWNLEAGNIIDPFEVRADVRKYICTRQSMKVEETPPPVQAGGGSADQSGSISDDELSHIIGEDLFGDE